MAQKITTIGELREALSEYDDDLPTYSVSDMGELKDLFIYDHNRKRGVGFTFNTEMVIVLESNSPHWEFNL